jgi:hypothetical protein
LPTVEKLLGEAMTQKILVFFYKPTIKLYELSGHSPSLILSRELNLFFNAQNQIVYLEEKAFLDICPYNQIIEIKQFEFVLKASFVPQSLIQDRVKHSSFPKVSLQRQISLMKLFCHSFCKRFSFMIFYLILLSSTQIFQPPLQAPSLSYPHLKLFNEKMLLNQIEKIIETQKGF